MKRFKRNIMAAMAAMVAILCLVSMGVTAFAEEAGEECQITFSVTDKTGGIFVDDIAITLLSDDGALEYTYTMNSVNYLFGTTVSDTIERGNYHIALSFASKGDFSVLNADGTPITSVSLMDAEHAFNWMVVYNGGEQPQGSTQGSADGYIADTGNAEADAVWNAFLEAVAPVETDSEYASILKIVKNTASSCAKYYAKATGGAAEDYLGMPAFEQFLWYATYVLPVNGIKGGDYDFYCGSETAWISNTVGVPHGWLKSFGSVEMLEAYEALMLWDYHYFLENGTAYNFMAGKSSGENNEIGDVPVQNPTDGPAVTDPPVEPTPPVSEEPTTEEDETGIWGGTIALIKENAVTIIILLALAGVLGVIIIYRKKKAIDD